jgi:hypothetical protein
MIDIKFQEMVLVDDELDTPNCLKVLCFDRGA